MIHNIKHLFKNKNKTILFAALIALLFLSCANDLSKTDTTVTVTGIVLSPDESGISLVKGTTRQINAHAVPENATDKKLTYTSDNEGVASVTAGGLITAKAVGSAKITIKASNGISKTINVTVTAAHISVTGIVLSPDESGISLVKGTTRQINAHAVPENATDKKLTYTSDKAEIASVNADGLITAKAVGSAKITIKASNNVSKEITVTVTAAHISVTGIVLSPDESGISLVKGTTRQINAHAVPENATDKKLTYISDKESVASVNDKGLISTHSVGSANITIKAPNGVSKTIKVSVTAAHIHVTSIIFNPPLPAQPIELVIGQVYKFGAKAMPEEATNKKLTFATSNSSIAWLQGEGNSEVKADGLGEATVTITSDDNPTIRKLVHFKMKQKPEIKIKTNPAECESNGGEATFTIETLNGKLDYTPEVVEGGAKWLSVAGKDHTDESTDTVRLTVQTNKTVWNRTARIRFKELLR